MLTNVNDDAMMETSKQTKLRDCKKNHLIFHYLEFVCAVCIATRKYTANGQKPRAPSMPTIALMNGSMSAITVVRVMNTVHIITLHCVNLI